MGILAIAVGALLAVFVSVQRTEAFSASRSESLDAMRVAVSQMTKDIRQASALTTADDSTLAMSTYVLGVAQPVTYRRTGTEISRQVGTGAPALILREVANTSAAPLFRYSSVDPLQASLVEITLLVHPPRRPDTILELQSKVRLRNRSTA